MVKSTAITSISSSGTVRPSAAAAKKKQQQKLAKAKKSESSIETMLESIRDHIDGLDFPVALDLCNAALEMQSDNVELKEIKASLLLELGREDGSLEIYRELCSLQPENARLLLCLAQLSNGSDALCLYERAIAIYKQESMQNATGEDSQLSEQLSSALCAIAELYMTDLCFDERAEELCEQYVQEALKVMPYNPECYQTLASLRLSQMRMDDASKVLCDGCRLWVPSKVFSQCMNPNEVEDDLEVADDGDLENADDMMQVDDDDELEAMPSYPSRLTLSKLLIECGLLSLALVVLETLHQENDEIYEVWYLMSTIHWMQGSQLIVTGDLKEDEQELAIQQYLESVKQGQAQITDMNIVESWQRALECLEECKVLAVEKKVPCDDHELMDQIQDLYATLSSVLPDEQDCCESSK